MLAASVAVLWMVLSARSSTPARSPAPNAGYLAGDRFPRIVGLQGAKPSDSLIMYVASTCRYCTESMAFYQTLFAKARTARLVAMGFEPKEKLAAYLASYGLQPDDIVSIDPSGLRFRGTPTLLLIGSDGVVKNAWVGRLDSEKQKEVLKELNLEQ
jgi:hypothetical protein